MNKTKLAALGMLTSLICILTLGSNRIFGDNDCPEEIYDLNFCSIVGLPSCKGGKEISPEQCKMNKGVFFHINYYKMNPKVSTSPLPLTVDPIISQENCYTLCNCKPIYGNPPYDVYLGCDTDENSVIQHFLAPVQYPINCEKK
jgi:hypothetical protein